MLGSTYMVPEFQVQRQGFCFDNGSFWKFSNGIMEGTQMWFLKCFYLSVCVLCLCGACTCVYRNAQLHMQGYQRRTCFCCIFCPLPYSSDTGCLTNPESSQRAPITSPSLTTMLGLQLCLLKIASEAVWDVNESERRTQGTEEQIWKPLF